MQRKNSLGQDEVNVMKDEWSVRMLRQSTEWERNWKKFKENYGNVPVHD